jgi:hypothetical protein
MILASLKSGIQKTAANKRMILIFYLGNLILGLIIILPLRAIIDEFVGYRLMGAKLAGRLDMDFLFELLLHNHSFGDVLRGMIFFAPAVYWLFLLFLSGGAFVIFAHNEKYSSPIFWGNCGRFFGRFIRLSIWSLPLLAVFFALPLLAKGLLRLFFGSDPYQYITYWGRWLQAGLGFVSFLLFGMVLDYARIHTVLTDERNMRASLWRGFRFAFGKFKHTLGLAALLFVIGGLILAMSTPVANGLAAPSAIIVALMFLIQQFYMILRMGLRLTLYAGQIHLYKTASTNSINSSIVRL